MKPARRAARELLFGPWRAVLVLGIVQILTWGALFYPPVLTVPLKFLNTNAFEFNISLVAADPRKYSDQWRSLRAEIPQATSTDGLNFAVVDDTKAGLDFSGLGLSFGASNASGRLQLANAGTAPSTPIFTLVGPLVNPTLTSSIDGITQYRLTYNATLGAGERVVIDPAAPSVLLDGTASRRWLLNPAQFSGFHIPPANGWNGQPGALNVGLSHQGATDAGGYATADYRDAYF